ncbi:MFS transporter [Actinoplanes teichomyceticus]|uniref:MFS transporter n=1 Tax=Actinoplanes teichomyceticus TaxID=1867 RepID=A0A561WBN0_ACTTI|nr:MFS transporter [Actinoplanes teichomyceticus]TWG21264.1 MFS transporter [Actinoplanes teichomyceticus]GIF16723.1 MFS transporter [Actinoplanes teichomyceticus]
MTSAGIRVRYMAAMIVDATGSGMYLPLSLIYFHHTTGLPIGQVGAVVSAAAVLGLLSNPLTGVLVDRFGARAVVTGGYLLRAAAFTCYPLVDSAVPLFLAVLVVAFGDVSFSPSVHALVAEISTGTERDRLIAAQRSIRNAGLGAGGLIASGVLAAGDDHAFTAIVLTSAAAFAGAAALIRSIPAPHRAEAGAAPPSGGYRTVVRNRPFLGLTLLNIPTAFGYMVLAVSLPVYLTTELDQPASLIGTLYAVNTVGIALAQIQVTRLLTRFRRTRAVAAGAAVFAVSFVSFAVLGIVSTGVTLLVGVFVATAIFTLGELLHGATASALVVNAAPEETRGRHIAVYQLSWAVPSALAPAVLTGLLALSPAGMWLVLAAGVTVSALGVLRLEPRLPAEAVRTPTAMTVLEER